MKIKFSHNYPKLHGQKTARLLAIELRDRKELTDPFIEYDTKFDGGYYKLPADQYMILVFIGNDLIPFTTVRRFTDLKFYYYTDCLNKNFIIECPGL